MSQKVGSRYRLIVVSAALFVLFDAAVLTLNFVIADQIRADTALIDVAGRQRTLGQQIFKALLLMEEETTQGVEFSEPAVELRDAANLFDETLYAFIDGGETTDSNGLPITVPALTEPEDVNTLEDALLIWSSIYGYLLPMIDKAGAAEPGSTGFAGSFKPAISYIAATEKDLMAMMNTLTVSLERASVKKISTLRAIQLGGLVLALINFIVILLHFIRSLSRRDEELAKVRNEADQIIEFVPEGLFLINSNYVPGQQRSKALASILPDDFSFDTDLITALSPYVSEKARVDLTRFLKLLFDPQVFDDLIADLNPLAEVQMARRANDPNAEIRHLEFVFERVVQKDTISHLLVAVRDQTRAHDLRAQIEHTREEGHRRVLLMTSALRIPSEDLTEFLRRTDDHIESAIRLSDSPTEASNPIRSLRALLHGIKGDAVSLDLEVIADVAHAMEDELADANEAEAIPHSVVDNLEELAAMCRDVGDLALHFSSASDVSLTKRNNGVSVDHPGPFNLLTLARTGTYDNVHLFWTGTFNENSVPAPHRDAVRDALTQLVRNATAHGIEAPNERIAMGKPPVGTIEIRCSQKAEQYILDVRDDGRGIDLDRVREVAMERGLISPTARVADSEAVKLLFSAGFTTTDQVTQAAGRGIGLDVVSRSIRSVGGKIAVATKAHQFTRFRMTMPKPALESAA